MGDASHWIFAEITHYIFIYAVCARETAGLVNQCISDADPAWSGSGSDVTEVRDFAFQAVRLLQGVGATTSFALNSTACDVSVHLYSPARRSTRPSPGADLRSGHLCSGRRGPCHMVLGGP